MSVDRFIADPWGVIHKSYEASVFHVRPAPEFATAEVIVASLYRSAGFQGVSEREVPSAGRDFDRASQQPRTHERTGSRISIESWRAVLHGILESPKQPNQSSKRFLQLCPVLPDVALYSGSARLAGNSWNPGALVQRLVQIGSESSAAATALWSSLFAGLSVGASDDIWARWLQDEFVCRRRSGAAWAEAKLQDGPNLPDDEKLAIRLPARQFVRDLQAIIDAKPYMTRRQWVSLLESCVRIGVVAHVLWLCDVNARLWNATKDVLAGREPLSASDLRDTVVACDGRFLTYGNPAVPIVRDYASGYLTARLGLNLLLWHMEAIGKAPKSLSSSSDLAAFLRLVAAHRDKLNAADVLHALSEMAEDQTRTITCKKGIGSNLVEFARHVLGQRQTANESLRGYDQGYFLRKRGEHVSAPWVVSLGPVAVLALVHCCLRDAAGPRSVQRLCQHLAWYGIEVDLDDIAKSDLGRNLRMLGLILDSPDAESGMLLVPPFDLSGRQAEGDER